MSPSFYSPLFDSLARMLSDQLQMMNLVSHDELCTIIHIQTYEPLSNDCRRLVRNQAEKIVDCNQVTINYPTDCHYFLTVYRTKARQYRQISQP